MAIHSKHTVNTTVVTQYWPLENRTANYFVALEKSGLPQAAFWPQAALRAVTYCTISSLCPLCCVVHSLDRVVCPVVLYRVVLAVVWDGISL